MTEEPTEQPESFVAFEEKAKEPEGQREVKEPSEVSDKDTLELGGDEAPEVKEDEQPEEKKRSRPWSQRVDNLTARLRDAERRAAEAEARVSPQEETKEQAPDPFAKNDDGSDKYEFGEADPQFLRDDARFAVREELRAEREKTAEGDKKTAAQREIVGKIETGMASIEKAGVEKYDDFEAKIGEAVEARGGEPLPPLVSIGIAVSPAGADIAYRLATDEKAASKIENLARTNPRAAAMEFGELEGQYLDNEEDNDLNMDDPLDMARLIGRERARRKGLKPGAVRKLTQAPEPAEHRSRGANGQFETRPDTEDFAAFERMANRKTG